jgi:hypothetical protein
MSDFISIHIVKEIEKLVNHKRSVIGIDDGWFWFDEVIKSEPNSRQYNLFYKSLNRVKISSNHKSINVYPTGEVLPVTWVNVKKKDLLTILDIIKNNKFFTYKRIDGKDLKVRLKNKI